MIILGYSNCELQLPDKQSRVQQIYDITLVAQIIHERAFSSEVNLLINYSKMLKNITTLVLVFSDDHFCSLIYSQLYMLATTVNNAFSIGHRKRKLKVVNWQHKLSIREPTARAQYVPVGATLAGRGDVW